MEILYNGTPCCNTPRSGYTQQTGLCTKKATIRVCRIRRDAHCTRRLKLLDLVYERVFVFSLRELGAELGSVLPVAMAGKTEREVGARACVPAESKKYFLRRPVHAGFFLSQPLPERRLTQKGRGPLSRGQAAEAERTLPRRRCIASALRS